MKRIIQLLVIGAACVAGRGQTTNQLSANTGAAAHAPAANNSEIAELRAEVAALRRQVEVLTVALQQAQQSPQAQKQHSSRVAAGVGSSAKTTMSGGSSMGTSRGVSFSSSGQPLWVDGVGVKRLLPNRRSGTHQSGQPLWVDGVGVKRLRPNR